MQSRRIGMFQYPVLRVALKLRFRLNYVQLVHCVAISTGFLNVNVDCYRVCKYSINNLSMLTMRI